MTIRHLKIFITVAETGKMSTAASRFYISQPAVSQAIKDLENHYDVLLFERISKKLYITESGKKLLSYAKKVVEEFDMLEEDMMIEKSIKRLRIGVTVTVGTNFISNVIDKFKMSDKNIDTFVYMNNTKAVEKMILNSDLDIGVVEGNIKSRDLEVIPEVDDFLVLVCSKNHPFAKKKNITQKDLEDADFVMREKGSGTRELFEQFIEKYHLNIKTTWEVNCPNAIKQAVLNNNCVAVISVRLLEDEIKNGSLFVIENVLNEWDRKFSVVYRKNKKINEFTERFIDTVRQNRRIDILDGIETGTLKIK